MRLQSKFVVAEFDYLIILITLLNNLESFTSLNGSNHYGLKPNSKKIRLLKRKNPITFIDRIKVEKQSIIVFKPDFPVFCHFVLPKATQFFKPLIFYSYLHSFEHLFLH